MVSNSRTSAHDGVGEAAMFVAPMRLWVGYIFKKSHIKKRSWLCNCYVTAHLHQLYQESVLLPPTANHLPFQLLAKCSDQLLITVHFDYLVTAYSVPLVRFMSNGCCPWYFFIVHEPQLLLATQTPHSDGPPPPRLDPLPSILRTHDSDGLSLTLWCLSLYLVDNSISQRSLQGRT